MGWFWVIIFPLATSLRIRSALFTPMACDISEGVMVSSMCSTFLCSDISVISVCLPFLADFFLWPRMGTYWRWCASATRSCLEMDSVFSTRGPFLPFCLSLVTSMNSRPRPGPPDTTASSRTSPTGRGRKPPPPGPGRGGGRAMGIRGRDSTTARVAVGRAAVGSATCTDWVPPGPRMMGPLGCAPGARAAARGGGGRLGPPLDLGGRGRRLRGRGRGGGRLRGDGLGSADRLRADLRRRRRDRLGADLGDGRRRGRRRRRRRRLGMLAERLPVGPQRIGLLAAQHYAAGRRLGRRRLGSTLAAELLRHRQGLIVLQ